MKLKFLLIAAFFLLANNVARAQTEKIVWAASFAEAEKMARETGKPLLIDFTAEWCGLCRQMDNAFWPRADVVAAARDFVSVRIDGDKFPQIADRFGVRAFPTVVFADGWNAGRDSYMGFSRSGDRVILDKAKQFPKNFALLKASGDMLEKDKSRAAGLMNFAEAYRREKLYIQSVRIYRDVLKTGPKTEIKETALLNAAADFLKLGQPAEALALFEQLNRELPASARRDEFLYGIFYAHLRKNDAAQAAAALARLKAEFPTSKTLLQAEDLLAKEAKK